MKILVLNSGSSSIKYKLFLDNNVLFEGIEEGVVEFHKSFMKIFKKLIKEKAIDKLEDIEAFGHRVVHGGEYFSKPTLIDDKVIIELEKLIVLAPLHNPANIDGIKIIKEKIPNAIQVAIFDTAFHSTLPMESYLYPLPFELYEKHQIRKYGFHGTSHFYVAKEFAKKVNKRLIDLNLITLHLGNGSSITAIKKGKSIDTSMGFTPLAGLMMGTRCGDIDPSVVLYLHKNLHLSTDEIDILLNKQSGFKGICGTNDLRDIIKLSKNNDKKAKLAINIFVNTIRDYLSSYILKLGKVDGIIFTGGIGENSAMIRKKVLKHVDFLTTKKSKHKIMVIKTNEEKEIASQVLNLIKN